MKRVFNHTLHKELWQWLVDNPEKNISDWPRWEHNGGSVEGGVDECFACWAVNANCSQCPLDWGKTKYCGFNNNTAGIIDVWDFALAAEMYDIRSYFAAKIRDMPIKADWDGEII